MYHALLLLLLKYMNHNTVAKLLKVAQQGKELIMIVYRAYQINLTRKIYVASFLLVTWYIT